MIEVEKTSQGDPLGFHVRVREDGSSSEHDVTLTRDLYRRLSGERHSPEACIEAAFRFLLDHEPKESILSRFDISVISRYFPEFERAFPDYLDQTG